MQIFRYDSIDQYNETSYCLASCLPAASVLCSRLCVASERRFSSAGLCGATWKNTEGETGLKSKLRMRLSASGKLEFFWPEWGRGIFN